MSENSNDGDLRVITTTTPLSLRYRLKTLEGVIDLWKGERDSDLNYHYLEDENYIIVYYANREKNIPVNIVAAYNIHEGCMEDLTNYKTKGYIKNMFFINKELPLNVMLQMVTDYGLDICSKKEYDECRNYICGGKDFSDEEIINYLTKEYPFLKNYVGLFHITVKEYAEIQKFNGYRFPMRAISYNLREEKENVRKR